jgi:hypothetical protein
MIPAPLRACGGQLRDAIARREYDDLGGLLDDLRRAAEENIQGTNDPATRREIARWMLSIVDWARLMLTTQRQRWADEITALPRADRFLAGAVPAASDVCVDL